MGDDGIGIPAGRSPAIEPPGPGWFIRDDEPGLVAMVGPFWQHGSGDDMKLGFLARPEHANRRGVVHGGMIVTFADQVLGSVAIDATPGRRLATVQLDTYFVDAVTIGEFVEGRARIERRTRSILFMSGSFHVGDRLVATAHGVWKVLSDGPR